ncbi:MAG TPA: DNA polymerase III subunit gamma and tau [Mycobacteriales bacterium]|nr:DNA polymerase III subunit gamma and tau [Mycobacteriales bacterium]
MSLALYRKYRPGTFAEVVGQEHVTEPISQALRNGKIHHAYLFSGPRGCGKTSSARILARSLNCEKGPTPTPCGVCDSCVALAPMGPGSLDVVEIDAASHGLVDDARDLRERAYFAPVSSRFKVYIIDEAHMITTAAFNALLKVVEEPPPHVKFIFATTEPDKVLATIRSRTFHYRFRLIPPQVMREHLAGLCEREGIEVDPLVLPLIVRAGGGSARDAQSILDQLAAGAGDEGITYARALSLLGYTDGALLDEVVDAFGANDGAAVFGAVDRVIEAGLDPRRFAQDLLERFRDLLVLDAVPDAGENGLLDLPADELERMRGQAARSGRAWLSRAADLMAAALVEMRGTTSTRLVLELAAARVLLPGAASDVSSLLARLDRMERRLAATGVPAPSSEVSEPAASTPESAAAEPAVVEAPAAAVAEDPAADEPAPPEPAVIEPEPVADQPAAAVAPQPAAAVAPQPATPGGVAAGGVDAAAIRRLWDDVLEAVKQRSRVAFTMLSQYATVIDADSRSVTLEFTPSLFAKQFEEGKAEVFRQALKEVAGLDLALKTVGGAAPAPPATSTGGTTRSAPAIELEPEPDDVEVDLSDPAQPAAGRQDPQDAALALLQDGLGAQVIGEIDHS